ncbi:MAG: hypothetical protein GTO24_02140 [candidate division Zixibacteria bacterium]|nr:hypothetical protein [candidate division Zixibacteria bacterium]
MQSQKAKNRATPATAGLITAFADSYTTLRDYLTGEQESYLDMRHGFSKPSDQAMFSSI